MQPQQVHPQWRDPITVVKKFEINGFGVSTLVDKDGVGRSSKKKKLRELRTGEMAARSDPLQCLEYDKKKKKNPGISPYIPPKLKRGR
jgi:hypothetical protein